MPEAVETLLPNTARVVFAISEGWTDGRVARAVCVKDAGDDPDATNGAHLTAEVRRLSAGERPGRSLRAGLDGWLEEIRASSLDATGLALHYGLPESKYPPAKPGALIGEPLKAAIWGR